MDEAEVIKKRTMPNSIEAEQSVLGSMLMNREAVITAMDILQKEDFYYSQYGIIFENMVELFNEKKPVDLITLQNRLKERNVPEEISSLQYAGELVSIVPTAVHVGYYARIVKENAQKRELIKRTEAITNECLNGDSTAEELFSKTEADIFKFLSERGGNDDYVPISEVVYEVVDTIEKASHTSGEVTGIPTGFYDLDRKLAGLHPSELLLVAARPAMGKTAFVLNIADYVCFKKKMPVAIFSLEMSKAQLVNRMFSLESGVEAGKIRTGDLNDEEWKRILDSSATIGTSGLVIDDTPGITISELRSKCYRYKREMDIKLVIIDYLQLMSGSGKRASESRQNEISEISRSLKALARELDVPVIALSQLSREVEKRPDHRPMLSDLRESGAIEQDADVVMFIYRDDYYNKDSEKKGIAEIIVAKQRSGSTGTIDLVWIGEQTKFANYEG